MKAILLILISILLYAQDDSVSVTQKSIVLENNVTMTNIEEIKQNKILKKIDKERIKRLYDIVYTESLLNQIKKEKLLNGTAN